MLRKAHNQVITGTRTFKFLRKRTLHNSLWLHSSISLEHGGIGRDYESKVKISESLKNQEPVTSCQKYDEENVPASSTTNVDITQPVVEEAVENCVANSTPSEKNIRKSPDSGRKNEVVVSNIQKDFVYFDEYVSNGEIEQAYRILISTIKRNQNKNDKYHQGLKWDDFSCLIEALRIRKGRKNAKMATEVLEQLILHLDQGLLESKRRNLAPLYGYVLKLWNSCTLAPERIKLKNVHDIITVSETANTILEDMEKRKDTITTRHSYNLILSCYLRIALAARNAQKRGEDHDTTLGVATIAAEKSEELFVKMVSSSNENQRPNLTSYKTVLTTWSTVGSLGSLGAVDRILALLSTIEEYSKESHLDSSLYSIVFNALAQAAPLLEFDPKDPAAPANKGVTLLRRLVSGLKEEGPCPLDAMSYASIINAFAKSKTSENLGELAPANLASACLRQCHELHKIGYLSEGPNDYCYGNAIAAWTRHLDTDLGCEKAEALLNQLESHIGPKLNAKNRRERTTIWYNMVLNTFSKSSFPPQRAETILRRMESLSIADHRSYQAVLANWGNPRCQIMEDRSVRALQCLRRMDKTSIACYNTALAACQATDLKYASAALDVAEQLFSEIPRPNAATYSRMISVYISLLSDNPTRREAKVEELFQQCCNNGHVSILTFNLLLDGLSDNRLKMLLGEHYDMVIDRKVDLQKLPERWWKRNRK